ncbi:MAG: hypothetical protein WCG93_04110 [Paludibacter sp.]
MGGGENGEEINQFQPRDKTGMFSFNCLILNGSLKIKFFERKVAKLQMEHADLSVAAKKN